MSSKQEDWIYVQKIAGCQLRASTFKVCKEECLLGPELPWPQPWGQARPIDHSNEDESGPTPHTTPTVPDTFSSATSDCKPPERKYITCQPSTVAREAVSGESPHRSETTPTPETPAPNAHVHTCYVRVRVKPASLKDYIVGV